MLKPFGDGMLAIINDNYIIGPKEVIIQACKGFAMNITEVGLEFQLGNPHTTPSMCSALLNGTLFGVISQMGQSLMLAEIKSLDWQSAMPLLAP
jgi:hypothetical protein